MLLRNVTYLDPRMRFRQADLVMADGIIETIAAAGSASTPVGTEVIDCSDKLVVPGLINGHFHSQANLGRGLFRGTGLHEWGNAGSVQGALQQRFFDYLDTGATEEELRTICMKSYAELLHLGVTFTQDSGLAERPVHPLVEAAQAIGIRAFIDAYCEIDALASQVDGRVRFGGHLPEEEDITDETLAEAMRARDGRDTIFMTHCLETTVRKEIVLQRYNQSTIELFAARGLLNERTVLFHGVEMTDQDIALMVRCGTSLAHCPVSNLSDIAPVAKCLELGVNVCLGSDFGSADLWEVMRVAYYLQKGRVGTRVVDAETVWRMATVNGAKAYYLDDQIGSILEGHRADLVFIDAADPRLLPVVEREGFSNRLHNLLLGCRPDMIRAVMIDGRWVVKDGVLLTVDEQELDAKYAAIAQRVAQF